MFVLKTKLWNPTFKFNTHLELKGTETNANSVATLKSESVWDNQTSTPAVEDGFVKNSPV